MENMLICLLLSLLILLPLARKWELGIKPVLIGGSFVGVATGAVVNILSSFLEMGLSARLLLSSVLIIIFSGIILFARFYRDPERVSPTGNNIIVAPADGVVKYVRRIEPGNIPHSCKGSEAAGLAPRFVGVLPDQKGYLLGIAMNFLDVHVTRAPLEGKVVHSEHVDGSFYSLKRADALYKNERVNQIIRNGRLSIGLIHIASRLVRRIVPYVNEGDNVVLGQRIGMIKFGSQVDLILPEQEEMSIRVRTGEKITAGVTIIATY